MAPSYHRVGWRIQSNMHLKCADVENPYLPDNIGRDYERARKSLIVWDEITEFISSLQSTTSYSREVHSFVRMIRKLQCEFLSTTQYATDLDRKMLRQTELFVLCRSHIPKGVRYYQALAKRDSRYYPHYLSMARRAYVELFVFDVWGNFTGNAYASKHWPPDPEMADKRIILRNLHTVWDTYISGDYVPPVRDEEKRRRLVGRQWNMSDIRTEQERLQEELAVEETEARFAEHDEKRRAGKSRLTDTDVIGPKAVSTLEEWAGGKVQDGGGEIALTRSNSQAASKFVDGLHSTQDLEKHLRSIGFEIETRGGGRKFAVDRGGE